MRLHFRRLLGCLLLIPELILDHIVLTAVLALPTLLDVLLHCVPVAMGTVAVTTPWPIRPYSLESTPERLKLALALGGAADVAYYAYIKNVI